MPWEDLAEHIRSLIELMTDTEVPVYTNWPSKVDAPCVVVRPTLRTHVPNCDVQWELAVDVVSPLTVEYSFVHQLVEAINEQPLKGYIVNDTDYSQRSIAGGDYLFATTAVIHRR